MPRYSKMQARDFLCADMEGWLQNALLQQDRAGLVLTGGKSITGYFDAFKKMALPWSRLNIFLSDDRLVADDDPASNEKQLFDLFLNDPAIRGQARYYAIKHGDTPDRRLLPATAAFLSMGVDGHVASLFNAYDFGGDEFLVCVSRPDYERVSLSYKTLQAIGKKYILVNGDQRIDFLEKINIHEFYLGDLFSSSTLILVHD